MQRRSHNGIPSSGPVRPEPNLIPAEVRPRGMMTDFVLYVHNSCPRSNDLIEVLKHHQVPSVLIQNVADLRTRPQWLDGVPILADAKIGLIYKGSDAIAFVTNLIQQKMSQTDSAPVRDTQLPRDLDRSQRLISDIAHQPPTTRSEKKSPLDDLFDESVPATANPANAISLPDNSHRYTEGKGKVTADSIAEYMSQRQKQVKSQ